MKKMKRKKMTKKKMMKKKKIKTDPPKGKNPLFLKKSKSKT
jgi:hypothetical protein